MIPQYLLGGTSNNPLNASATEYQAVIGRRSNAWNATRTNRESVIPASGVIKCLRIELDSSPSGNGYDFTIVINGADSALTTRIGSPDTQGSDLSSEVSVSAGDVITIKAAPLPGETATPRAYYSLQYLSDSDNYTIRMGSTPDAASPQLTELNSAAGGERWSAALVGSFNKAVYFGFAGTLRDYYVDTLTAPGTGKTITYSIGLMSVALSGSNKTGSDTLNTVAVTTNSQHSQRSLATSLPSTGLLRSGFVFETDEAYTYSVNSVMFDYISATNGVTEYNYPDITNALWASSLRQHIPGRVNIVEWGVRLSQRQASAANSITFELYKNDGPISGSAMEIQTASYHVVSVNDDFSPYDRLSVSYTTNYGDEPSAVKNLEAQWYIKIRTNEYPMNGGMMAGMGI